VLAAQHVGRPGATRTATAASVRHVERHKSERIRRSPTRPGHGAPLWITLPRGEGGRPHQDARGERSCDRLAGSIR
jgi:hypothetical protein